MDCRAAGTGRLEIPCINPDRRRLLAATPAGSVALIGLAACGRQAEATLVPIEADAATTYDLDGMLMADYPEPRVQLYCQDDTTPHWCCDTVEIFSTLLKPEQAREIRAVLVQDMGQVDREHPRGHWFDAKTGYYVFGGRRRGSMGPMVASFWLEADARAFVARDGGKLLRYAEVTPDMVDPSGGVLHSGRM